MRILPEFWNAVRLYSSTLPMTSPVHSPQHRVLRIGTWRVDPALDEVSRDGQTIKLEPMTMRLLACLAAHAGQVMSVQQLLDEVWGAVIVTPDSVYRAVATLRRVLGDDSKEPSYIVNVLRRGYRLVAPTSVWLDTPGPQLDGSANSPLSDTSIAVLPFVDMSEKKDQEYFADGMAEEVGNLLATVPGIRVIGRTSSFQFKGKNEDLRTIGRALGATYVVEGSVRRSGNRLRVSAQLISAQDGSQRWSQTYDRDFDEVLKIQDQIAAGLVRALQVAVGVNLPSRPILKSAAGYDLYQRGRHALDRFDKAGFESAAVYFQNALELDPTALRATEALALVHRYIAEWGYAPPGECFGRARRSANRVLELDPRSGVARAHLAFIHAIYDWDWEAALAELNSGLAASPRDPEVLVVAGFIHMGLDRSDEAATFFSAAAAIDPLFGMLRSGLGTIRYRSGRLAEAEAEFRRALEVSPTFLWARWALGLVLLAADRLDEALSQMRHAAQDGSSDAGLAMVFHAMGRTADSDAALARAACACSQFSAYTLAQVYSYRAEADQALAWLDRALRQKDVMLYRVKGDPLMKTVRADARFQAVLKQMHLST